MAGIDYNVKVEEIKGYLTDAINDIMIKEAGKDYIIISRADQERYAHMSIIAGLFYYFEPLQKIYFYYTFDKNVRWGLANKVKQYYIDVLNNLYNNCRTDINCTIELLGPSYLVENTQCAKGATVSKKITPYTVGYWLGTNNQFEYINDPGFRVYYTKKYDCAHNILDTSRASRPYLEQLKTLRDNINNEYDTISHPYLIPTAFASYKTDFESIMTGIELPDVDEFIARSNKLRLLNITDFYGL